MNCYPRAKLIGLLAFLFLIAPALLAQDDAASEAPTSSRITVLLEGWIAQPAGLDYQPATLTEPTDPLGTTILTRPSVSLMIVCPAGRSFSGAKMIPSRSLTTGFPPRPSRRNVTSVGAVKPSIVMTRMSIWWRGPSLTFVGGRFRPP